MSTRASESKNMALATGHRREVAGQKTAAFSDFAEALILTAHDACSRPLSEGIDLLRDSGTHETISCLKRLFDALGQDIGKRTFGPGFQQSIGVVDLLTVAHVLWLADEVCLGESLIRAANQAPFNEESGKFWGQYVSGFVALIDRTPWQPRLPKVSGIERHWAACLMLVSDVANGRSTTASVTEVRDSFARCNNDKRVHMPGLRPDPSGVIPLIWDFRLEAIRYYCLYRYQLQL